MDPKVTIHLTSYNHEPYLKAAIDSVLAQTFTDYELVITDDCSTDNSRDIIRSYDDPRIIKEFPDVRYMRKHGERVIKNARGKYVAVHHSDDVWLPDKLEKQVAFLDSHTEVGAVFSHARTIGPDGSFIKHPVEAIFRQPNRSRHQWLRFFFCHGNALCHPSVLMRKGLAIKHFPSYGLTGIPDLYKWISLCLENEIHILQEPLVYFRVHPGADSEGGNSARNIVRFAVEIGWIIRLFKRLKTLEDWLAVFPEAQGYVVNGTFDPDFVLAQMCLNTTNCQPEAIRLFGIHLLLDIMDNQEKREQIEKLYGFTTPRMGELSTSADLFNLLSKDNEIHQASVVLDFGYEQGSKKIIPCLLHPDPFGNYTLSFDFTHQMRNNPHKILRAIRFLPSSRPCMHALVKADLDGQEIRFIPTNRAGTTRSYDVFDTAPIYLCPRSPAPRARRLNLQGQILNRS